MGSRRRIESSNYRNPCLTMHQPWASLLVYGIKRIEGRSWPAPIRGKTTFNREVFSKPLCFLICFLFLFFIYFLFSYSFLNFELAWICEFKGARRLELLILFMFFLKGSSASLVFPVKIETFLLILIIWVSRLLGCEFEHPIFFCLGCSYTLWMLCTTTHNRNGAKGFW